MILLSTATSGTTVVASSVLQNNGKLYSPQYMLEDSDIRCWNSNPGDQQYIILKFGRPVRMMEIKIQFQAGFSSEILRLRISTNNNNKDWQDIEDNELEPEDKLGIQSFPLVDQPQGTDLRIDFLDFRDFYGRIVIYRLQVWGLEIS